MRTPRGSAAAQGDVAGRGGENRNLNLKEPGPCPEKKTWGSKDNTGSEAHAWSPGPFCSCMRVGSAVSAVFKQG